MNNDAVVQMIMDLANESKVSRYEAAEAVRGLAEAVMSDEREERIKELRKIANEGEAAAKELVELGAPGAPRKTARKRAPRKKTEAVAAQS